MVSNPAAGIAPDRAAVLRHLEVLFEPAELAYPKGLIEVVHGSTGPNKAAHFSVDAGGRERAADWICRCNSIGENTYIGVNPRKPSAKLGARNGAESVEVAFFHFADLDDQAAVERARSTMPLKPNLIVITGTVPANRPHFYWELEEPTMNLQAWSEQQRSIALALGGDAVIDPPRIMRVAGTINYPPPHKIERGYTVECGTIRSEFVDERPPVTPDIVAMAFPHIASNVVPIQQATLSSGETTLSNMSRRTRAADLIEACRTGDQWHNSMVRLVAHLVSAGRTDAEILGLGAGITLPGYTADATVREMHTALRGARTKWAMPEPAEDVEAEEAGREDADSVFELLDLDQLEDLPPPTWLIDELIADHGLSIVYGDPGAGKSFIVLDMALRLAFGMDWHGVAVQQTGVVYIAGEGARGLGKRVKGWRREHALEGADAPFLLLPVAVQMLEPKDLSKLCRTIDVAIARANFKAGLVVVDTVSRALAGQDENGQESMSAFVKACGEVQEHTGGAVIGVHHSGKDKERGMRGSTVLLGACDASMKITKNEQIATIQVEKQKDAEEAANIHLTLKKVEWATGLGKEESTLVPEKSTKPLIVDRTLSRRDADATFDEIDRAWTSGNPWSVTPHSKSKGRWLPLWMAEKFEIAPHLAEDYITSWLQREYLKLENYSRSTRAQALCVVKRLEQDQ